VLAPGRGGGTSTPASLFRRAPEELCTSFIVENENERVRMHYSIQDTPGYGDSFDIKRRLDDIIAFVTKQQGRYLNLEKSLATESEPDPRVDVCLYFIPPHRLKEVDVEFMKQLGAVVPLIPIIAKADSMTTEELDSFREVISTQANQHSISFFKFTEAALTSVGATGAIPAVLYDEAEGPSAPARSLTSFPPFAVVSSEMSINSNGVAFWPVRRYQWGTCEAFNRQHSDCSILKRLLLEEGFHDVKVVTKEIYARFKREKMNPTQPASARSQVCFCDRPRSTWRWMDLFQRAYQSDPICTMCAVLLGFFLLVGIGTMAAIIVIKQWF